MAELQFARVPVRLDVVVGARKVADDHRVEAVRSVLAERERELLELKGPCDVNRCLLHYDHSGPCRGRQWGASRD